MQRVIQTHMHRHHAVHEPVNLQRHLQDLEAFQTPCMGRVRIESAAYRRVDCCMTWCVMWTVV